MEQKLEESIKKHTEAAQKLAVSEIEHCVAEQSLRDVVIELEKLRSELAAVKAERDAFLKSRDEVLKAHAEMEVAWAKIERHLAKTEAVEKHIYEWVD
jgi:flagellar hook-basal body complex protein FliE